ncbi:hypothetical protein V5799_028446 [Amblyomma americanum]|uniref:Secreted protein n=1 Tax=Amblyomma americanum TaxID=6943 RepID=A0AAQ4DCU7_AMBAM
MKSTVVCACVLSVLIMASELRQRNTTKGFTAHVIRSRTFSTRDIYIYARNLPEGHISSLIFTAFFWQETRPLGMKSAVVCVSLLFAFVMSSEAMLPQKMKQGWTPRCPVMCRPDQAPGAHCGPPLGCRCVVVFGCCTVRPLYCAYLPFLRG